jgi:hypothetical protein
MTHITVVVGDINVGIVEIGQGKSLTFGDALGLS